MTVLPGPYRPCSLRVEGDWSAACFLLAAAAVTGGEVGVRGLDAGTSQADALFPRLLRSMGVRVEIGQDRVSAAGRPSRGLRADLSAAPDSVPALAAVAAMAPGESEIRGVAHLRHKESDRIAALAEELRRLGAQVSVLADGLRLRPARLRGALVDPRGDHRVAMALAVLGLTVEGVSVAEPGCVAKSFPGFWEQLERIEEGSAA
jgi:3-phosphoshikimate 1-carboxyvinyltransferase